MLRCAEATVLGSMGQLGLSSVQPALSGPALPSCTPCTTSTASSHLCYGSLRVTEHLVCLPASTQSAGLLAVQVCSLAHPADSPPPKCSPPPPKAASHSPCISDHRTIAHSSPECPGDQSPCWSCAGSPAACSAGWLPVPAAPPALSLHLLQHKEHERALAL